MINFLSKKYDWFEMRIRILSFIRSQDVTNIPIPKSDIKFLIINSNVHHNLATSEYSVRRQTCENVAKKMLKKSLRDATLTDLDSKWINIFFSLQGQKYSFLSLVHLTLVIFFSFFFFYPFIGLFFRK